MQSFRGRAGAVGVGLGSQARKGHININFFVRLVPVFTGFVPGTNPVCPWDKSGEKQGHTQEFSLFYTVEARFHRVCPWNKPGLSQGQSRGRRAAQKVYVKTFYVPFSLARVPNLMWVLWFVRFSGHLYSLRWHVCRVNFARKIFFEPRIFLRKMLRYFPRTF